MDDLRPTKVWKLKPACINHPEKNAVAKGLCAACYQKQRRAMQKGTTARLPNGHAYAEAIECAQDWATIFYTKIKNSTETGCNEWTGTKNSNGYGVFNIGEKTLLAHRLSRALAGGDVGAQVVMHACDNPSCVNPNHLIDGTYKENSEDMHRKGRWKLGQCGQHLKDRKSHPRARAVVTPYGRFASASLAADIIPISARTISHYCSLQKKGFRYES